MSIDKLVGLELRLSDVSNRVQALEGSLGNTQQLAVEGAISAYSGALPAAATAILGEALTGFGEHIAEKDAEITAAIAQTSATIARVDAALGTSNSYLSRSVAAAVALAGANQSVETFGYAAFGDGGGARYNRSITEPPHAGKFQDASGFWWELDRNSILRPEMFGAKGGGVTDDRPGINAAIAVANYRYLNGQGVQTVQLASKTYVLKTKSSFVGLLMLSGVHLRGESRATTTIKQADNLAAHVIEVAPGGQHDYAITDLTIDANRTNQTNQGTHGIRHVDCYNVRVERVRVTGAPSYSFGHFVSDTTAVRNHIRYDDIIVDNLGGDGWDFKVAFDTSNRYKDVTITNFLIKDIGAGAGMDLRCQAKVANGVVFMTNMTGTTNPGIRTRNSGYDSTITNVQFYGPGASVAGPLGLALTGGRSHATNIHVQDLATGVAVIDSSDPDTMAFQDGGRATVANVTAKNCLEGVLLGPNVNVTNYGSVVRSYTAEGCTRGIRIYGSYNDVEVLGVDCTEDVRVETGAVGNRVGYHSITTTATPISVQSKLNVSGPTLINHRGTVPFRNRTTATTLTNSDCGQVIRVTAGGASVPITLPVPALYGRTIDFYMRDSAGTVPILNPDGSMVVTLSSTLRRIRVIDSGTTWNDV